MQPMQPIEKDERGTVRFKPNAIVRYILEHGGIDMNHLACVPGFPVEDQEQFAQLIGYSLGGYSELSYVRDESYETAMRVSQGALDERDARIAVLQEAVHKLRLGLRGPIADLFGIHPDDLMEG